MRKFVRYCLAGFALLSFVAAGSLAYGYPTTGAVVCPSCYGMEHAGPRIIVEKAMPAQMRAKLLSDIEAAETAVRSFYGTFNRQPYLVVCSTEECDHRMGGRGAKAATLSVPLVTILRLSPRGMEPTILTHEFSHVEFHQRVGLWARMTGSFPAWFDEGVAVLVSDDARYLKSGATASKRCARNSEGPLPTTPIDWGPEADNDPMLYADAVCRVLQWMEANGGKAGLLETLDSVANGVAFIPENGRQN